MNEIEKQEEFENPLVAIVLMMKDGRAINVSVSGIKGITMTQAGEKTSISVEFDVPSYEISKNVTRSHRELGK